jgi:dimethylargininase
LLTALTRQISPRIADCELTFQHRAPIDLARAQQQHSAYCAALADLGVNVLNLPALPDHPDCVFVEDPAIVLDEVAILTRLGAESRRGESPSIADALRPYRELRFTEAPATLDGGDVMQIGKTLYVGRSRRTNFQGIQQLAQLVTPFGYWVTPVEIRNCLHLKTACTWIGDNTVLGNREWLDLDGFCGIEFLDAPEPHAANVLRVGDNLLMPSTYPKTQALLKSRGHAVRTVDISELIKAEAGVTCLSLLFNAPARNASDPASPPTP